MSSPELAKKIIDKGVLEIFYNMMDYSESKMLIIILESIEKILICGEASTDGDGLNILFEKIKASEIPKRLQGLQMNPDQNVFELAGFIIEKYFEHEEVAQFIE